MKSTHKLKIIHKNKNLSLELFEIENGTLIAKAIRPYKRILSRNDLKDLQWYLEDYLLVYHAEKERGEKVEKKIEEWGHKLFRLLFPEGDSFYDKLPGSLNEILFEFVSDDNEFHAQPWELMKDPEGAGIISCQAYGFHRNHPRQYFSKKIAGDNKLKILFICARDSRDDYNFRASSRSLIENLEGLTRELEIEFLRPPTFKALSKLLHDNRYDIIHFDGHGNFENGMGLLCFENEEADGIEEINAERLANLIGGSQVRLFVLDACRSAMTAGKETAPDVARKLLRGNVTTVLANGYSVYVDTATRFMKKFYELLAEGQSVAESLGESRRMLRDDPEVEEYWSTPVKIEDWGVPVLYQKEDTILFPKGVEINEGVKVKEKKDFRGKIYEKLKQFDTQFYLEQESFFGRDDEFHAIERVFRHGKPILLHGDGGVGKSSIVHQFAYWYAATKGCEIALYFNYESEGHTADSILDFTSHHYMPEEELSKSNDDYKREWALKYLRQKKILIVLDNFETAAGLGYIGSDEAFLNKKEQENLKNLIDSITEGEKKGQKLSPFPCRVLIASRSTESWLGENIYRLPVHGLSKQDAQKYAKYLLKTMNVKGAESKKGYDALMEKTGGHPLTMRILFRILKEKEPLKIIDEWAGHFEEWDKLEKGRNRSLYATFSYGWSILDEKHQRLFASFSPIERIISYLFLGAAQNDKEFLSILGLTEKSDLKEIMNGGAAAGFYTETNLGFTIHPALPYFLEKKYETIFSDEIKEELSNKLNSLMMLEAMNITKLLTAGKNIEFASKLFNLVYRNFEKQFLSVLKQKEFDVADQWQSYVVTILLRLGDDKKNPWKQIMLNHLEKEKKMGEDVTELWLKYASKKDPEVLKNLETRFESLKDDKKVSVEKLRTGDDFIRALIENDDFEKAEVISKELLEGLDFLKPIGKLEFLAYANILDSLTADILIKNKKNKEAESYLEKYISLLGLAPKGLESVATYAMVSISYSYFSLKNYDQAKKISYECFKKFIDMDDLNYAAEALMVTSACYRETGDYRTDLELNAECYKLLYSTQSMFKKIVSNRIHEIRALIPSDDFLKIWKENCHHPVPPNPTATTIPDLSK